MEKMFARASVGRTQNGGLAAVDEGQELELLRSKQMPENDFTHHSPAHHEGPKLISQLLTNGFHGLDRAPKPQREIKDTIFSTEEALAFMRNGRTTKYSTRRSKSEALSKIESLSQQE